MLEIPLVAEEGSQDEAAADWWEDEAVLDTAEDAAAEAMHVVQDSDQEDNAQDKLRSGPVVLDVAIEAAVAGKVGGAAVAVVAAASATVVVAVYDTLPLVVYAPPQLFVPPRVSSFLLLLVASAIPVAVSANSLVPDVELLPPFAELLQLVSQRFDASVLPRHVSHVPGPAVVVLPLRADSFLLLLQLVPWLVPQVWRAVQLPVWPWLLPVAFSVGLLPLPFAACATLLVTQLVVAKEE